VLRLRWFDPEPDGPSTPIDWRVAAMIIATLFLNFAFWMVDGGDLWMSRPLPLYVVQVGVVAFLVTALFFLGPALATQTAKRPLFGVIENSLGIIPTLGIRICGLLFLLIWMAKLLFWPSWVLMRFIEGREVSFGESGAVTAALLVFVILTSLHGPQTTAKLAYFSNGLGLAILAAALIRVHRGWPEALKGFHPSSVHSDSFELWQDFSRLAFSVAPLALLAANFGYRSRDRKAVAMTALAGMAVPLAGMLLLIGIIGVATIHSGLYRPSVTPNVAMALWSYAATSALPARMAVAAITIFGAMRFGIRALVDSMPRPFLRNRWSLVAAACIVGTFWYSLRQDSPILDKPFQFLGNCLAVTTAVLTADFLTRSWRIDYVRNFDPFGVLALAAGVATFYLPTWIVGEGAASLLPSYGVAFVICVSGRGAQQVSRKYA
jgi:hypothetical protein